MLSEEWYQEIKIFKALEELDNRLKVLNVAPFELNVVGGFALLLEGIRRNRNDYTDIDYVGRSFNEQVKEAISEVGAKYGFERNWINNDVLLAGSNLKELEFATGKLHFIKRAELSVITINSLDKECLLRMKIIAIDTSLFAFQNNGDFTRLKDFPDVKALMDFMGYDINDVKRATEDYVMDKKTFVLLEYYLKTGKLDMFVGNKLKAIIMADKIKHRYNTK
jgi:hypothetical protein